MPLVVGIDEAGYGPLLGPLVIGATVWRVPQRLVAGDWWDVLRAAVARKPLRQETRLVVNDSKIVFDRKHGVGSLERSVLTFAEAAGVSGDTVAALLRRLGVTLGAGQLPPWYRDLSTALPIDPAKSRHATALKRLRDALDEAGVRCERLLAEVVTEPVYNGRVRQTHNKAAVLSEHVLRLMTRAAALAGDGDVYVNVDRLGGRQDYRSLLLSAFPDRHLHVVSASESVSSYRLASQRDDWHVRFLVDADQHELCVALASMLAKYVREVLMLHFNAFWSGLQPQLRATAGYYKDALRFLKDIAPLLPASGLRREDFVRVS